MSQGIGKSHNRNTEQRGKASLEWVKVAQPCLTFCDPKDYRVHGIIQARILEWVAFPFSRGSSQAGISCIAGRFFTS